MDPYDELPYRLTVIEWTAPERLALASLLHGGPRVPLDRYRVLELGCGDGTNLLPLAYYRPHAAFVGVDGSRRAIDVASARQAELALPNLQLIHADFISAADRLAGPFDIVLAHGVLSWVPDDVRDALLALCVRHLRPGGLVYLNYNARPGWNVRGMVRDFLIAQTARAAGLRARAELAQQLSATLASLLAPAEHPYARLMEREFRFVCDSDLSYVAHEHLAPDNHAYWRSELLALAGASGLHYVADADFNYNSGRISQELIERLSAIGLFDDAVDLLAYRQLHSPILTSGAWAPRPPEAEELANLVVASCLAPLASPGPRMFRHPTGFEVEAKEEVMGTVLERLFPLWPGGARLGSLFPVGSALVDDIRLLHRHGLIELRLEHDQLTPPRGALNDREARWGASITTPHHTREVIQSVPQPYLFLFDTLIIPIAEVVKRVEPILATGEFIFGGEARKFERGRDRSLYYREETVKVDTLSDGVAKASSQGWPGVAFECRYLGYDVTVGVFQDAAGTILVLDHDSVLVFEIEKDVDKYHDWLTLLILAVETVEASVCVFRKGGLKEAIDPAAVVDIIRKGVMAEEWNPIVVIIRAGVLPYADVMAVKPEKATAYATTSGYTVISLMHRDS